MSQFPHDEFAKEYIPELIKDYGEANSGENISAEIKEIDVIFKPTKEVPTSAETLGLLGRMAQNFCLFEVYRNPVKVDQINECIGKRIEVQTALKREKKKNQEKFLTKEKPFLWILTPTLSAAKLALFKAEKEENWSEGIYFLGAGLATGIVVIHQLEENQETLWLRILGRGKVQEKAIEEIKALPKEYPHRENILELISNLFVMLEIKRKKKQKLVKEEQELSMKLSSIYLERLAEKEQIGLQRGIQQEINLIFRQLKRKLGNLSPGLETRIKSLPIEKLEDLGEALLNFNSQEDLINWLENN